MAKEHFTIEDLRRWQEQGLLSDEQLKSIIAEEGLETEPQGKERRTGLNPVSVAYYFGGFLALLSFTFFVGMNWDDIPDWARICICLVAMLIIGPLGAWLRFKRGYPTAGGLLLFVATGIFPLFVITIAEATGIWPDSDSNFAFLYWSLVSLPVVLVLLFATRFTLISLIAAALVHIAAFATGDIADADGEVITAATCGGFVLIGLALTLWGKKAYTFWLKLYGLVGLQIAFTILFIDSDNALFGLLFFFVYLFLVGLSLRFREVIYLVFGAIGFYTYIIRLVADTFEGTVYFPLLLGFIGISIVVLAVLYQRFRARLFRHRA